MLPSTYSVEAGRNKKIIRERLELGSSLFFGDMEWGSVLIR